MMKKLINIQIWIKSNSFYIIIALFLLNYIVNKELNFVILTLLILAIKK